MTTLNSLMSVSPGLQAAARADNAGSVHEVVGNIDGETLCASIAMCAAPFERVSNHLALGMATQWSFVSKKKSLYVVHAIDGLVAVIGEPSKNPDATVKKLAKAIAERK